MTALVQPGLPELTELKRFAKQVLNGRRMRLMVDDEQPVDVPAAVASVLAEVVAILSRGRAVSVMAQNTQLTTGEAAEILGVTRPTIIKLLDDGVLPYTRPNSSRRIELHDVLAYKAERSKARRAALDDMTADAVEAGIYDHEINK